MTALLVLDGVTKRFGGLRAVGGIGLSVQPGSIYSLIGPNGAGKTTLFNLISAVLRPTSGSIRFDGHEVTRLPTYHALAAVGDRPHVPEPRCVQARDGGETTCWSGLHTKLRDRPALGHAMFLGPGTAGGDRGRASGSRRSSSSWRWRICATSLLARCPMGSKSAWSSAGRWPLSPRLLLLDEMVSGMNQEEREDIARFVLDLRDELGVTVLMVEHDMGIVMDISDRVCVMNQGRKDRIRNAGRGFAADPARDRGLSRHSADQHDRDASILSPTELAELTLPQLLRRRARKSHTRRGLGDEREKERGLWQPADLAPRCYANAYAGGSPSG